MNVENFAEWLRRQGHQVIRSASSYWYDAGPRVFQAFPYHWLIQPSEQELRHLMLRHAIVALRYSTPVEAPSGMVSYHVVGSQPYNLDMLRAKTRNSIRRGLENFHIETIPFSRLADEGWALQQDTLQRQRRLKSMSQADWQRICRAAEGLAGFEAWGATTNGVLAGALVTARIDDTCCVPYAISHSRFLSDHVNNALFYVATCDMLAREGVRGIFYTLHSLDAPESVDEFKFRMSFTAKPVRQRVVFHPWLWPFANKTVHNLLVRRLQRVPDNPLLAKAEGMLRFYLEGKQPLNAQAWPKCLSEYRAQWLPI